MPTAASGSKSTLWRIRGGLTSAAAGNTRRTAHLKPSEGLILPDLFTMSDTNFRDHPLYELRRIR